MQALIILDAQKGLLKMKDFSKEIEHIHTLIDDFKQRDQIVISTRHILERSDSIFDPNSVDSELEETIGKQSMEIVEK
ncbi:isochorismatase family protein [Marinilactibacillus sp. Marseille-P9653]|uniref:isochorismatase family protein n=1 Tax=Marinilactibacillus sp. Marseille-P9653 TaxID=2866583 RepID=UPI0021069799|nr:isochorismatase family protein [Marinilactibacillus sp. Marseille-P9653]